MLAESLVGGAMVYSRYIPAALAILAGLAVSGCSSASNVSDAPSNGAEAATKHEPDTSWRPKWDIMPDKSRKEKSILTPTVSFADPGFRGSPVPQNEREKKKATKNQEDFIESFKSESKCFGIALKLKNPGDADFALQVFSGIDGRTGRLQWVLYRMDTVGAAATGEGTGASTKMGRDGMVQSVCSSIHDAVFNQGGSVE
jgi:hypothetical protein